MTSGMESPRRAATARFAAAIFLGAATLLAARSDAAPRGVTPTRDAPRAGATESRPTPPAPAPAREARPAMPRSGGATGTAVFPGASRIVSTGLVAARAAGAGTPPVQIASYPVDGQTRVPANAELYFVFDQPTSQRGIFSVADLDSFGGTLLVLNAPRWSALGDTVFLKPTFPMEFGHSHGMRVNLIVGPAPDSLVAGDQPIVLFSTVPRASLERVPSADDLQSVTLVAGSPTPVAATAREKAGTAVSFTAARIEFWAEDQVPIGGPTTFLPIRTDVVPVAAGVPRFGVGRLVANVTVPRDLARATGGRLGLRIVYEGTDETGLPFSFEAISRTVVSALGDTTLSMAPASITPRIAGDVVVRAAALEWPLPGAAIAAGDTIRPRAVVTGDGTGPFRAAFVMDGDLIGIEEGFMESGRPVTVTLRGPLPTRRFGEHRLQFVVEAPQGVAAQPVTFICVPPANGLTLPVGGAAPVSPTDTGAGAAGTSGTGAGAAPPHFALESTWLADGRSAIGGDDASVTGWASWRGRYEIAPNRRLEATMTNRLRFDDTKNGSATPEQLSLRYVQDRATVEWGDIAPSIASGAPLLASPVPRRGAQATWTASGLGTLEGFLALESRPRAAAGPLRDARSDLYAARLTRSFGKDRLTASLYGGYTHEDPTPGGEETATRARAIYGGSALLRLRGSWTLLGDAASVRHRAIAGVEPGRTRTGARAEVNGVAAGFAAHAEAFRYQPDLATALNPYGLSDRKGFDAGLSRPVAKWRFFGGYRSERPEDASSGVPDVKVARATFGGTLRLNQESTVTPSIIRITQKGDQTDFKQTRLATEFTESEPLGGRTTARFDVGFLEDAMGLNTKRIVTSGSVVSVRRHPGRLTSTITAGYEENQNRDLDARDLTFQGSMEVGWEAVASRFLVAPFVSYATRDYELEGTNDRRLSARLQLSLLRLPALGDAALSVSGHADRVWLREPSTSRRTDTGVELSLGKRIPLVP
ncbi:MAG TPA: hypothetical protein VF363_05690 [Candidatus Eisenbacteria bacterium]